MEYIKVAFTLIRSETYQTDLLIEALGEAGFDTFDQHESSFDAYIIADNFSAENLQDCLDNFEEAIEYSFQTDAVVSENWNEEWEKNFSPLIVGDQCYVRATFHDPEKKYPYEIVIDPKMAFGTGHHETTTMMLEYILESDLPNKNVLDMGCGTGILAILACKRGAFNTTAIDNDPICFESTKENAVLNNVNNILPLCGVQDDIPDEIFDIILANINRNILLEQIPAYSNVLASSGDIYFSGFYEDPDLSLIKEMCGRHAIYYVSHKNRGEWVAAHFTKRI